MDEVKILENKGGIADISKIIKKTLLTYMVIRSGKYKN
jgi:hypothetical protein